MDLESSKGYLGSLLDYHLYMLTIRFTSFHQSWYWFSALLSSEKKLDPSHYTNVMVNARYLKTFLIQQQFRNMSAPWILLSKIMNITLTHPTHLTCNLPSLT